MTPNPTEPDKPAAAVPAAPEPAAAGSNKRPAETAIAPEVGAPAAATTPAPIANKKKPPSELQKRIQHQLQLQLQEQLESAARRGQQADITPEQIQQQAAAMVQAAAQAQAVVAAAKSRGDGLKPMTLQQIKQLSQIQAAAIVNARKPQCTDPAAIQSLITLQAQALVHAHQQAQIQAGIYKGDGTVTNDASSSKVDDGKPMAAMTKVTAAPVAAPTTTIQLTPAQLQQLNELKAELALAKQNAKPEELPALEPQQRARLAALYEQFRRVTAPTSSSGSTAFSTTTLSVMDQNLESQDSNSPAFQEQLHAALQDFWTTSLEQVRALSNQTEQDFKNHNDLPLARIKRIMKSDEGEYLCVLLSFFVQSYLFDVDIFMSLWTVEDDNFETYGSPVHTHAR